MAKHHTTPMIGSKALEIRMRDSLLGLEDAACQAALTSHCSDLHILSISPPQCVIRNNVTAIGQARSRDVVEYLVRRETRLEHFA